jgi:diguanylate cyclase
MVHPITSPPNDAQARAALHAGLNAYHHLGEACSVINLRVDNLRIVNDTLGHSSGDVMLHEIGKRITSVMAAGGLVSHSGGDEFLVVLAGCPLDEASDLAHAVVALLREPMTVDGVDVAVRAFAGVATADDVNHTPALLLQAAHLALWRSDVLPESAVKAFRATMREEAWASRQAAEAISAAARSRHFSFHYQPVIDLHAGKVVALEALMRWEGGPEGLSSPGQFIPVLEALGDLTTIMEYLIPRALVDLSRWRVSQPNLALTVNLHPGALERPDVIDWLIELPLTKGLPSEALIVEVSESAMASPQVVSHLCGLASAGLRIWLDDFGTGWSSLSTLRTLPLDAVKLARTFVFEGSHRVDLAMLEAVVALTAAVGLELVAEGIETQAQQDQLARYSVRFGQGFHLARPMPASAVDPWLAAKHVWSSDMR